MRSTPRRAARTGHAGPSTTTVNHCLSRLILVADDQDAADRGTGSVVVCEVRPQLRPGLLLG